MERNELSEIVLINRKRVIGINVDTRLNWIKVTIYNLLAQQKSAVANLHAYMMQVILLLCYIILVLLLCTGISTMHKIQFVYFTIFIANIHDILKIQCQIINKIWQLKNLLSWFFFAYFHKNTKSPIHRSFTRSKVKFKYSYPKSNRAIRIRKNIAETHETHLI